MSISVQDEFTNTIKIERLHKSAHNRKERERHSQQRENVKEEGRGSTHNSSHPRLATRLLFIPSGYTSTLASSSGCFFSQVSHLGLPYLGLLELDPPP
ncbi:uncharacterized protein G2W53_039906 [Senna tora]|uniref:Uncharacterized protein n=1 Tax=Senna tora TaxID=362788 RepID=A0A834SNM0_9FABA|nr:uncharacterized protein G2W53_039906 [Senna tora]